MPPAPPPAPTIDIDLPCIACRYNLRTVPIDARCPECGRSTIDTFTAYANRLAGADPKWLRTLTSAPLWLLFAMLIPAALSFALLFVNDPRAWLPGQRMQLLIVLTPSILGIAACWRLGSIEPRPHDEPDANLQPITCWALRVTAIAWLIPLLAYASPLSRTLNDPDPQRFNFLLTLFEWSGLPATLLLFHRLKHLARRIPSKRLLHQCNIIGSQLFMALILESVTIESYFREAPDAIKHAIATIGPGIGLPWPIALKADHLQWVDWSDPLNPDLLLVAWATFVHLGIFLIALQFAIALIHLRRSDPNLVHRSRQYLLARSPSPSDTSSQSPS